VEGLTPLIVFLIQTQGENIVCNAWCDSFSRQWLGTSELA